ncbi:MAG: hypothetical protein V2G48_04560 [bacterium JZ-2024 1]
MENPVKGVIGVLFLTGIPLGIWIQQPEDWFLPAFALVFLLVILSAFFLPTDYELDRSGISIQRLFYRKRKGMKWIRRWEVFPQAIFLSPYSQSCWKERFEGIFLFFPPGREELIARVEEFLRKHHHRNHIQ